MTTRPRASARTRQSEAGLGAAGLGWARPGKAGLGRARQGVARRGSAWLGTAGQDKGSIPGEAKASTGGQSWRGEVSLTGMAGGAS